MRILLIHVKHAIGKISQVHKIIPFLQCTGKYSLIMSLKHANMLINRLHLLKILRLLKNQKIGNVQEFPQFLRSLLLFFEI